MLVVQVNSSSPYPGGGGGGAGAAGAHGSGSQIGGWWRRFIFLHIRATYLRRWWRWLEQWQGLLRVLVASGGGGAGGGAITQTEHRVRLTEVVVVVVVVVLLTEGFRWLWRLRHRNHLLHKRNTEIWWWNSYPIRR
jgi:hypothetical protein